MHENRREGALIKSTNRSNGDLAYQQIKSMIFHMELLPGDHVPELQVASLLSISRTPIHDALRRLEAERLVSISQNRGASVVKFTDREITEIGTIRIMQDILSAQLVAYYGSVSDFDRLDRMADECEEVTKNGGDIYERFRRDIAFHLEIAKISRNSRLLDQQRLIYQQIHLILIQLSKTAHSTESPEASIEHRLMDIREHKPLVKAIRTGDMRSAVSLLCQHTRDYYRVDAYFLKKYAEQTDNIPVFLPYESD